jgi:hypothetical protein
MHSEPATSLETALKEKQADTTVTGASDPVQSPSDPSLEDGAGKPLQSEPLISLKDVAEEKEVDTTVTGASDPQQSASDTALENGAGNPMQSKQGTSLEEQAEEKQADTPVTGTCNHQHAASATLMEDGAGNPMQSAQATSVEDVVEDMDDDTMVDGDGDHLQSNLAIVGDKDVATRKEEADEIEKPRPTGLYEPEQKNLGAEFTIAQHVEIPQRVAINAVCVSFTFMSSAVTRTQERKRVVDRFGYATSVQLQTRTRLRATLCRLPQKLLFKVQGLTASWMRKKEQGKTRTDKVSFEATTLYMIYLKLSITCTSMALDSIGGLGNRYLPFYQLSS